MPEREPSHERAGQPTARASNSGVPAFGPLPGESTEGAPSDGNRPADPGGARDGGALQPADLRPVPHGRRVAPPDALDDRLLRVAGEDGAQTARPRLNLVRRLPGVRR